MTNDQTIEALKAMDKPPLTFNFPEDSGHAQVKMSYGLEMDLRRLLPDPQTALTLLMSDPFTQDYVVRRCLTPAKKILLDPANELIPSEEVNLDSDTIDSLLMWAAKHALYFFAKRTASIGTLGSQFRDLIPAETPSEQSQTGSSDSALKTPSAGDLTA